MPRSWVYAGEAAREISELVGYEVTSKQVARLAAAGELRELPSLGYGRARKRIARDSLTAYLARLHGLTARTA